MIEQGTDAWLQQRLGRATASRIADVVAKTKSGWGASRDNYAAELITERLTGVPYPSYTNAAMKWGTEKEPQARAAYAFMVGVPVERVGFVEHPKIAMSGASPDGFVGKDGLAEYKCPETKAHLATLEGAPIDGKYIIQVQWQMACCVGRKWCDWVSFDPRLPDEMQLKVIRVPRDNKMIAELERHVADFLAEIDSRVSKLAKTYKVKLAA